MGVSSPRVCPLSSIRSPTRCTPAAAAPPLADAAPATHRAAALYENPGGTELRVYFEPEERDDLLQSDVQRVDVGALEAKADTLRATLKDKGWWALTS